MIGENRQLVTNEPVEFWEITGWRSRLHEHYRSFEKNLENVPQISKEKPKDVNM